MKKFFTLLNVIVCILLLQQSASAQQCTTNSGSNGISTQYPISIDGNMSDWTAVLNDPDNNTYDNTNGIDLDAPISDQGRDMVRFAFTEDANYLYLYLKRAGSSSNTVDILFYADIDNDGSM